MQFLISAKFGRFLPFAKKDCEDLCQLLAKYDRGDSLSVRLVHKHFDTNVDEAVVFRLQEDPDHGTIKVMEPVKVSDGALWPVHYLVDGEGNPELTNI
jgi:hypothetical protein